MLTKTGDRGSILNTIFMKNIWILVLMSVVLTSCGTMKFGNGSSSSSLALSSAIQAVDAKVPQYVSQIFADSMDNKKIIAQIVKELQEPIKGFSRQLFDEWVKYSNENSKKSNENYITYKMALPKVKKGGELTRLLSEAINASLEKKKQKSKRDFKSCREHNSAGECTERFVNGLQKSISDIVEKQVEKYLKERLQKL